MTTPSHQFSPCAKRRGRSPCTRCDRGRMTCVRILPRHPPDEHLLGPKLVSQAARKIPLWARAAAEQIEAERLVLGKGVHGEVRLREQTEPSDAARAGEHVPQRLADDAEIELPDDRRD